MKELNLSELHKVKELFTLIESNANYINANLDKISEIYKNESVMINNHILQFKHYKSELNKLIKKFN